MFSIFKKKKNQLYRSEVIRQGGFEFYTTHLIEDMAGGQYFTGAETTDGRFSLNTYSPGYVTVDGDSVYLQYAEKTESVEQARKFESVVEKIKEQRRDVDSSDSSDFVSHKGEDGWCNKCQSYCYGDCES